MTEIWKDIPGYEGKYQVSSIGRVRSCGLKFIRKNGSPFFRPGRILKTHPNYSGYLSITLRKIDCSEKRFTVHRLVAMSFLKKDKRRNHIDHINSNKLDNNYKNLQWVTQQENNAKQYYPKHEKRWNAVMTMEKAEEIRSLYRKRELNSGFFRKTAKKYGVSEGCIGMIVYNRSWIKSEL